MKNLFKNLMLVAVAAMAFVGCEQDIEVNATTEKTAVRVIAGLDETRSGFGDKINGAYDQVWNGGEVLSYHHFNYEQYTSDNSNVTLPEGESKKAEFNIELTGVGNADYSTGVIRIASPASSATAVQGGFNIKVPSEQTPLANSVDPAAHILTSVVEYYDGVPSTIEAQFEHAVAYGKMTLNNLPEGNYDYVTISLDNKTYKLYTTNVQNNVFWFGCDAVKPAEVKVSVVNETENIAYTKTLDLTKATNFEFVTGRLGSFSVEMDGVEPTTPEVADTFNPDVHLNAPVIDDTYKGTSFKFTFNNSSNYYRVWLAEENRANDMMAVGNYKGNGNGSSDNYTPDASHFAATMFDNWGRVSGSYARHHTEDSTLDVTYADGVYTIIITTTDGTTYGYKGMPDGWVAPSGSEGGEEPEQPEQPEEPEETTTVNVSLNSIEHYNYNGSYYYHEFKFSDGSNANVLRAAFDMTNCSNASINAGTYTHTGLSSLFPGTNYNITYLCIDGQAISNFNAGDMTITVDGNNYTISVQITSGTTTYNVSLNGTFGESEPIVTTPLTTPSNLKVTYNGTSATITWDAVDGVDYYGVTYGSTATNTLTNSVTLEGLSYNTDYTVNVVAYPSDTTLHTSSEAASITINIGEDPNAGGGETTQSFENWAFSMKLGVTTGELTLTDGNHTVTAKLVGRYGLGVGSYIINDTTGVYYATDLKVNGVDVSNAEGEIKLNNSYKIELNMTLDGVKYTGTSSNGL